MNLNEYKKRIDDPFDSDESKYRRTAGNCVVSGEVIAIRVLVSILLAILLAATLMWSLLYTIANGPSEDYRDKLVTDAAASGWAKWIPYTLLPSEEVDGIINGAGVGG